MAFKTEFPKESLKEFLKGQNKQNLKRQRNFLVKESLLKLLHEQRIFLLKYLNGFKRLVVNKLDGLVEKAKDNQKLRSEYLAMNLHDRDIKKQAYKDSVQEGALQTKLETARNMLVYGDSVEKIAKITNIPLKTVKELAKEIK